MFRLIGPNGAGKSTLMKILATLLDPDRGSAHLDSLNLIVDKDATRRLLGYLPQEFGVYPKMSAYDLLSHLAVMKGILNRDERKEPVEGLQALGTYSGGMKQRFGIARALLANPQLIIVDEPTAGLDPTERVPSVADGRHDLPGHAKTLDDVISSDLVGDGAKEWSQYPGTAAHSGPGQLLDRLDMVAQTSSSHGEAGP